MSYRSKRRQSSVPFYEKPTIVARIVLAAMALLLIFSLIVVT